MNFRFKSRPGKGVQCSSDPEFTFSNVPQTCITHALSSENNISAEEHSQSLELDYFV